MAKGKGIGGHTKPPGKAESDDWLTPREVLAALGSFDLDPCACENMPWRTANRMVTKAEDGLSIEWHGRVWLNPPYSEVGVWMERLAEHGDGIALIFARTETKAFQQAIKRRAHALLFPLGRYTFHRADGSKGTSNSGGPSVLVAYGEENAQLLRRCGIEGIWVRTRKRPKVDGQA